MMRYKKEAVPNTWTACVRHIVSPRGARQSQQSQQRQPAKGSRYEWRALGWFVTLAGVFALGLLSAPRLGAQAPAPAADTLAFEVATVKQNKSGDGRMTMGGPPGAGRFNAVNVPLRMLIRNAYQLQDFQIDGGPGWLSTDRWDVIAKAPEGQTLQGMGPGATPGQGPGPFQLMMRSLLAERFKLVVHEETREMQIYALVLARSDGKPGPELKPAAVDCAAMMAGRGRGGPGGPPPALPQPGERMTCGMMMGPGILNAGGMPMAQLASTLSQPQMAGRTVIDKTGLTGNFDFTLTWTPTQMPQGGPGPGVPPPGVPAFPAIDPNGPSIFTALQEQLGLKLESQKGQVKMLVIDRAERATEE